ncbi:MAG: metallophosphoesterase family protein, partial [Acidobacteriaceae bacterium]
MKILAVSDVVVDWIYSPKMRLVLSDTNLAIGCGDLPVYYLEFIVSSLDIPLFFVHGNHSIVNASEQVGVHGSGGMVNLHCRVERYNGYTFAGVEGSVRYNEGKYQYSQFLMWLNVFQLVPAMLLNRLHSDHFLHVFVSHAPPWGVHDQADYAHQGIKAFRWLLLHFHPDYHLHGHIHV